MVIWYIHGAGATERSFVWLHSQLSDYPTKFVNYESESVESVCQRLADMMIHDGRPAMLVGHSLGGIIAVITCARASIVHRVVTICAPFGGVAYADFFSWIYRHPLLTDLRPFGPTLTALRNTPITKPHLAIVGTQGWPFLREGNDGVISIASQTALADVHYQNVAYNHFEVLLSEEVAQLIRDFAERKITKVSENGDGTLETLSDHNA